MPFKVRCRLIGFMGDEVRFACHFGYKIGDEFIYDGEKFIGRICPNLLGTMAPIIEAIRIAGNKYCERLLFRYSGPSKADPSMKKYDGVGWAPLKEPPQGTPEKYMKASSYFPPRTEKGRGWTFVCPDFKTSALFLAEPFGLAESGYYTPYYRREMSILEKIKAEPGIGTNEIPDRFTKRQKEEIYPPLRPSNFEIMLDELVEANYIEVRDGKAYPKSPG